MEEFLLMARKAARKRGQHWEDTQRGIVFIEDIFRELPLKYTCELHGENVEFGWWVLNEKRIRKYHLKDCTDLKGLSLGFEYEVPPTDPNIMLKAWSDSPVSGKSQIESQDPWIIISFLTSVICAHDENRGEWLMVERYKTHEKPSGDI